MIRSAKTEHIDDLAALKSQYMQRTTAPLDGMWLSGFVPMATHYEIFDDREPIGFYCVNDDGYMLQFFMVEAYRDCYSMTFDKIVDGVDTSTVQVKGAFVSTAEPHYLSLCLDRFSRFEVNALMYQRSGTAVDSLKSDSSFLSKLEPSQLEHAVDFAIASIGAPSAWLTGYYSNLIEREELYGVWQDGQLIATGERRGNDQYQTRYADIGVIVAKSLRGRGMATQILQHLVVMNEAKELKSICSTEASNIAAQKAISRAGFVANHRIVQFHA